jgi:drug/metabolite transporter (DMT)-like permease
MVDLILGLIAAIGASTFYSIGVALQAMDAREAPSGFHLRIALARQLIRGRRWLLGTGLSMLGWPLQVTALLLAPLVVVQPALAAGLLVLLLAAERMLGERPGRIEHISMAAIIIGVAGVAVAAPNRSTEYVGNLALYLVLAALALWSLLPYILRLFHHPAASITMLSAGLAFGWSGVSTKLASDALQKGQIGIAIGWGVGTGIASALGALSEMSALQSRPAIQVAPVVFVTQTVVPVVLALLLLGEDFPDSILPGAALAASLALLIAGAALLARSPLLVALMEGQRSRAPSDSDASPSPRRRITRRSKPSNEARDPSTLTTRTSPARTER